MRVCSIASGSSGNCVYVGSEQTHVLIDAGCSKKKIVEGLNGIGLTLEDVNAILITHEHSDHVGGAGVISRKLDIPVYCNQRTFDASNLGKVQFNPITMMNTVHVAGMDIIALPTSHDAVEPCAYMLSAGDTKVLIATDTGKITFPIEHALEEADIAVVESNYDKKMLDYGPYPPSLKRLIDSDIGHMSNLECARAVKRTMHDNGRKIFLGHLSRHNNTPDIAKDTISEVTGIRRFRFDCLECQGDTRILKP